MTVLYINRLLRVLPFLTSSLPFVFLAQSASSEKLHPAQVPAVNDLLRSADIFVDASELECTNLNLHSPASPHVQVSCSDGFPTKISFRGAALLAIPESISDLTRLESLSFRRVQFMYPLPASLGSIPFLNTLVVDESPVSSNIPDSLGQLTNLVKLVLRSSDFYGSIPASLGNLTDLTELSLYQNSLTGIIPTSLRNLQQLRFMSLADNLLSGPFPLFLQVSPPVRLAKLDLFGNYLTGEIDEGCRTHVTASFGLNCLSLNSKCEVQEQRPASVCGAFYREPPSSEIILPLRQSNKSPPRPKTPKKPPSKPKLGRAKQPHFVNINFRQKSGRLSALPGRSTSKHLGTGRERSFVWGQASNPKETPPPAAPKTQLQNGANGQNGARRRNAPKFCKIGVKHKSQCRCPKNSSCRKLLACSYLYVCTCNWSHPHALYAGGKFKGCEV